VTEVLLVLLALGLVAACGAFVAAEFSLVTVDRTAVEREAEAGDRRARGVLAGVRSLSTQLSAAQVGITLTNLLIGYLCEPAIAGLIDGPLATAGVPDGAVDGVAITLALVLATLLTMLFGELVPKNLAIARPLQTAKAVERFQRAFTTAAGPAIRLFNGTADAALRRMGVEPQEELASARAPEELASLVAHSARQGTLAADTAALLQRSLTFGERQAADAMTPRERVEVLDPEATALDVLHRSRETGFSRFPVLGEHGERVLGIVHVRHALGVPHERRAATPVTDILTAPLLVPDTLELDELLDRLRRGGLQMAMVVNEFGGYDGVVTLEDLVEEIVGEVRDEHDLPEEAARRQADGSWQLSGLLRPDEVARITGLVLPEDEDYETIAGLVAKELERIPAVGDAVQAPVRTDEGADRAARLEVLEMDELRVDRLALRLLPAPRDDDEQEAA
jgi:CBS domain containing-hemolysin-like protein